MLMNGSSSVATSFLSNTSEAGPFSYLRERDCGGFNVQFYIHLGYPIPSGSGILVLISKSKPILIFVEVLIYKLTFVNCCGFQTD